MADSTTPPRKLGNTVELTREPVEAADVAWKLTSPGRGLDANLIRLAPNAEIATHVGGEVDVLVHVVTGDGSLGTETDVIELAAGDLVWLPHGSKRSIHAGPDGLSYLTVHTHREPSLTIEPARSSDRH